MKGSPLLTTHTMVEKSIFPHQLLQKTRRERSLLPSHERAIPPAMRTLDMESTGRDQEPSASEEREYSMAQSTPYSQEYTERREQMVVVPSSSFNQSQLVSSDVIEVKGSAFGLNATATRKETDRISTVAKKDQIAQRVGVSRRYPVVPSYNAGTMPLGMGVAANYNHYQTSPEPSHSEKHRSSEIPDYTCNAAGIRVATPTQSHASKKYLDRPPSPERRMRMPPSGGSGGRPKKFALYHHQSRHVQSTPTVLDDRNDEHLRTTGYREATVATPFQRERPLTPETPRRTKSSSIASHDRGDDPSGERFVSTTDLNTVSSQNDEETEEEMGHENPYSLEPTTSKNFITTTNSANRESISTFGGRNQTEPDTTAVVSNAPQSNVFASRESVSTLGGRRESSLRCDRESDVASLCSRDLDIKSAAASRTSFSASTYQDKEGLGNVTLMTPPRKQTGVCYEERISIEEEGRAWIMGSGELSARPSRHSYNFNHAKTSVLEEPDELDDEFDDDVDDILGDEKQQPTGKVSFDDYMTESSCSSISASLDPSGYSVPHGADGVHRFVHNNNYSFYNTSLMNSKQRPETIRFSNVRSVLERVSQHQKQKNLLQQRSVEQMAGHAQSRLHRGPQPVVGKKNGQCVQTTQQFINRGPPIKSSNPITTPTGVERRSSSMIPSRDSVAPAPTVVIGQDVSSRATGSSILITNKNCTVLEPEINNDDIDVKKPSSGVPIVPSLSFHGIIDDRFHVDHDGIIRSVKEISNISTAKIDQMKRSGIARDPPAQNSRNGHTDDGESFQRNTSGRERRTGHRDHNPLGSPDSMASTERILSQHYAPLMNRVLCGPIPNGEANDTSPSNIASSKHIVPAGMDDTVGLPSLLNP